MWNIDNFIQHFSEPDWCGHILPTFFVSPFDSEVSFSAWYYWHWGKMYCAGITIEAHRNPPRWRASLETDDPAWHTPCPDVSYRWKLSDRCELSVKMQVQVSVDLPHRFPVPCASPPCVTHVYIITHVTHVYKIHCTMCMWPASTRASGVICTSTLSYLLSTGRFIKNMMLFIWALPK